MVQVVEHLLPKLETLISNPKIITTDVLGLAIFQEGIIHNNINACNNLSACCVPSSE
jgi:hypothetical protein